MVSLTFSSLRQNPIILMFILYPFQITDTSRNTPTDISQNTQDHTDISQDSSQTIPQLSPIASLIEDSDPDKVIPRLVNTSVPLDVLNSVDPENWTTADVARFLTVNDCQPYCINFANINGTTMLQLTKDEIIEILEMKVGPSLKIFDLIQQLKCKIKQPQCRMLNSFNK